MISVVSFCGPDFSGNGYHDTQFFSFDLFVFFHCISVILLESISVTSAF